MVGRDICVIYGYLYLNVSLSPHLHTSTSPYLSLSLYIHTYIYIYICMYYYSIYIYIYISTQSIHLCVYFGQKTYIVYHIYQKRVPRKSRCCDTSIHNETRKESLRSTQDLVATMRVGIKPSEVCWMFLELCMRTFILKLDQIGMIYIYIYIHHLIWDIGTFLFIIFYTYSHLSVQALPQL